MSELAGIILAGGRGERLGGAIKANLLVVGQRLLDRVAKRLGRAAPLVVSVGPHDPVLFALTPGMTAVADREDSYAGPLAGVSAAVTWLRDRPHLPRFVVCTAVDVPFLPDDYVERLFAVLGDHDVAVATFAGQRHPTQCLWRFAAIAGLPDRVASGTAPHSLKALIAAADGIEADWTPPAADPFSSINTPADLAAAGTGLSRPPEPPARN